MKKIIFFCVFCFFVQGLLSQDNIDINVFNNFSNKTNKDKIFMDLQSISEFFFKHYYRYPNDLDELLYFSDNHYDIKNDSDKYFDNTIKFLKKNKHKLHIYQSDGLFMMFKAKSFIINTNDVCEIISLRRNFGLFNSFKFRINIFNKNGRNIEEIIGVEKCDSITNIFRHLLKAFNSTYNFTGYNLEQTSYGIDSNVKNKIVILDYSMSKGLKSFCLEDNLNLENDYFLNLAKFCKKFCEEQDIYSMLFCSFVIKKKDCD